MSRRLLAKQGGILSLGLAVVLVACLAGFAERALEAAAESKRPAVDSTQTAVAVASSISEVMPIPSRLDLRIWELRSEGYEFSVCKAHRDESSFE